MQDPNKQFAVLTITREEIAQAINDVLALTTVTDRLAPDDGRLTNAFCESAATAVGVAHREWDDVHGDEDGLFVHLDDLLIPVWWQRAELLFGKLESKHARFAAFLDELVHTKKEREEDPF